LLKLNASGLGHYMNYLTSFDDYSRTNLTSHNRPSANPL
jgi:hypothetical protein